MTKTLNVDGELYTLTTDHAASSYGIPVVVLEDGEVLGDADVHYSPGSGRMWTGAQIKAIAGFQALPTLPYH